MHDPLETDPTRVATRICEVMATLDAELGVAVEVARKRVFLSGVVASAERRRRAAARARMVCPDHEIVNRLEVRPCDPPHAARELSVQRAAAIAELRPLRGANRGSERDGALPALARFLLSEEDMVITNAIMGVCEVCGNKYDRSFQITDDQGSHVFDCFECAIHALAPRCAHCDCAVIGHGVETDDGVIYCCAHCALSDGVRGAVDHVRA